MRISEIVKATVDDWIEAFRDRLRGWATDVIKLGIEAFMDLLGKGLAEQQKELLDTLIGAEEMPQELKDIFSRAKVGGGEWQAALLIGMGTAAAGATVSTAMFPPLESMKQNMAKKWPYQLLPMINLMALKFRGDITDELFRDQMHRYGFADERIDQMLQSYYFYPQPQDLILWLAREVFEPDMIERYGLDDEAPLAQADLFMKAGVNEEQMLNYWRAHWEHASFAQVLEMLHRGLLTLEKGVPSEPNSKAEWDKRDEEGNKAMYEWYRVVEIPPYWRDKLTEMSWNVPTRVDVRRWYDMRTIDEQELYNIYHRMGYHGKDLDNYVLWTKVYVAYSGLLSRYSKGWITLDDVKAELIKLGMPAERVEEMLQESFSPESSERVSSERDLTKAEIVKGVKQGVITASQGVELLMDMGYDEDEADYILTINVEALTGSPETYEQFKDITQKYRRATGAQAKPVPEELKAAADKLVEATKEVERLKMEVAEEEAKVVDESVASKETLKPLTDVRVALHRAETELLRIQQEYDGLKARFKFAE